MRVSVTGTEELVTAIAATHNIIRLEEKR